MVFSCVPQYPPQLFLRHSPMTSPSVSSRFGLSANACGTPSFQLQGLALSPLPLAPKAATTSCLLRLPEGLEKDPGLREGIFILSCLPCPKLVARFPSPPPLEMGIKDRENSCLPLTMVELGGGGIWLAMKKLSLLSPPGSLCLKPLPQCPAFGEGAGEQGAGENITYGEEWRPCDLPQASCPTPSPLGWHQLHTSLCVPAPSACTGEVRVWRGLGFASTLQAPWPLRRNGAGAQNQHPCSFCLVVVRP